MRYTAQRTVPRHGNAMPSPARSRTWFPDISSGITISRRWPWNLRSSRGSTAPSLPYEYSTVLVQRQPVIPSPFVYDLKRGFCDKSQYTFCKARFFSWKDNSNWATPSFSKAITSSNAFTRAVFEMPVPTISSDHGFTESGMLILDFHSAICTCQRLPLESSCTVPLDFNLYI